jgi:hypothetical protein
LPLHADRVDYPPPSGPPPHAPPYLRASISEGMDMPGLLPTSRFTSSGGMAVHGSQVHNSSRYHPFQASSRRPNLAHRASVPAIFHNAHHQSAPAPPLPSLPATPTSTVSLEEQQQQHHQGGDMYTQDAVFWNNPDPFGACTPAVALTPDAGYSFGMAASAVLPASSYEFPERKHSVATSDLDTEYTFSLDTGLYRRPGGSVVSLCGSASSAGPSLSDVTSDGLGVDANGRRWSCVSATDMLDGMTLGAAGARPSDGGASPAGAGSDGYTSEHGTVTYPSPTSDSERIDMRGADIGQSPIPPNSGASSELALALHSNESSPFTPPPAFKLPEVADGHTPPYQQYPSYSTAPFGGGEYHSHANGYPMSGYPRVMDGTDAGGLYAHSVPSPTTADDYTAATRYT